MPNLKNMTDNTTTRENTEAGTHEREPVQVNRFGLIQALHQALPSESILQSEEELRPFECDGLTAYRRLPLVAVLPETVAQVQAIMRICHQAQVPVVARGAGTGLSGGALPLADGVLLSLAKFNRIVSVDKANRTARVQSGVSNLAISERVAPLGLYYAPDPSSQIACSIGGNVAENSGGVHCLKYGLTVHNILELDVITAEGDRIRIGSEALDSPGYDLLALMTGSEGLLGVIVEVVVKLLPKPESVSVLLAAFDDIACAGAAVSAIIAEGIIPSGLEFMDKLAVKATNEFTGAGYPANAAAIVLCELDGAKTEIQDQIAITRKVLQANGALHIRVAANEAERIRLWAGRKAAFPAAGRLSPDYYCMDGTIPRRELATVLARIQELSVAYDLQIMNVFHAGDGNLHPVILYDANQPSQMQRTEELGGKILELCVEVGGTISGEHGVGIEKLNQMCVQFPPQELLHFHAVKRAFDPAGLLNPGKAVPTLQRCAEFGAVHVHHNERAFAHIERF